VVLVAIRSAIQPQKLCTSILFSVSYARDLLRCINIFWLIDRLIDDSQNNICNCNLQSTYNNIFRPPGTLVPGGLMFYCRCFFSDATRSSSLFRSPRNFATWLQLGVLYNVSPKIWGPSPKVIGGQKHAKFGAISGNFRLRSRISPERDKTSKIGKKSVHHRFLPRSMKKVPWTLVHKLQRTRCEFGPTQIAFFGRLHFGR